MRLNKQNYWKMSLVCIFILIAVSLVFSVQKNQQKLLNSTDFALRMQWFDQHINMKENSPFKEMSWKHLGPTNVSGRCTDIAVITPKGKHYTIYVATASGGVWKTENEG
ncbi:MAG: hypothetical protein WA915_01625, partial [Candidatus Aminicenantaceae bacterium]